MRAASHHESVSRSSRAAVHKSPRASAAAAARGSGRAFSLVELLVVLGVITLLVALLFPVISRAWAQARFTKCKANLQAQVQAHRAYGNDYKGAKPPLMRLSRMQIDFVSPDVQWGGEPVGHGLLIGTYLPTIDCLLDPSEAMGEDADRDRQGWEERAAYPLANSGSSYVYYWRRKPQTPPSSVAAFGAGITYEFAARDAWGALILDINAESDHPYLGEYQQRSWVNHPRIGRLNVAFLDGSVQDFPVADVMLKGPGQDDELRWVEDANRALAGLKAVAAPQ